MIDSSLSLNYYKNSLVFKAFILCKIILFGSIVLSISCGSSLKVGYDYDTEKDFTQFKTYDFMDHPSTAHAREYVVRRIKHAINLDLSSKGMKLSSDDPDILVAIHPKVSQYLNISNWGYSYAPYTVYWGGYGYWWGSRIDRYQYKNGTLIIDLIESEKRALVWRGVAEGAFPEIPVSEQIDKIVRKAVTKILKNYPPPKSNR